METDAHNEDPAETIGNIEESNTLTKEKCCQTTHFLSQNTPRKQKLRKLLRRKRHQITSLSSTSFSSNSSPKKMTKLAKANKAFKLLEGTISPDFLAFIKKQVSLALKKKQGRRYDDSFKAWALSLYHISGKAYRFLAKLLNLPSKSSLTSMVSRFASDVGFSEKSIFVLKQRVDAMTDSAKVCTLLMDEMSLKSNLFYNESRDSIIGFEDLGEGKKSNLVANSALVFMARGIVESWKQPVSYYLVNESCNSDFLKEIVEENLLQLGSMGLNVLATVSDQGSNFLRFYESLGVSVDRPFFEMHGKRYFTIFDPPHLLKSIRNNLLQYNFQFEEKTASWKDVSAFFDKEQKLAIRTAPKLTVKHINPTQFAKMKVKLATQVFSHSVAAGINTYVALNGLPSSAVGTAELLSRFDQIFDLCNSLSFKDTKICRRPLTSSSPHLEQMKKGANFIASIKVINAATRENRTNYLKCLKGWCITLQAIPELWSRLNRDFDTTFLVTRQLNQDPLENFFGSIRQQGGNSDNPTPVQFKRAYRKLFHTNLLSVSSTNCEIDENVLLTQLTDIQNLPELPPVEVGPLKIVTSDYSSEHIDKRIFKDNAMAYVAGYLLRKTFQKHKCEKCAILADESGDLEKKVFLMFKAYDSDTSIYSGLIVPSVQMLQFANKVEEKFISFFNDIKQTTGVGKELLSILVKENLDVPCTDFDKVFLLKLFIRMRIHYSLKYVNRELVATKRKNRKYIKIVHL